MPYSRWLLADLQVHTPADKAHRYGDVGGPDPNLAFARTLMRAHRDAGVAIVAVTDHNRVDWWPLLREAGDEVGVFVFPGLEINVNKCHLLALWERDDAGFALAQRFLGNLFEPGVAPLSDDREPRAVSSGSPLDLARKVTELHGLVLAPHATARDNGLFGRNVCNTSSEVAQSGVLAGFDVIGATGADVLVNPRSEFGDVPPAWFASGDTRALSDVGKRAVYLKTAPQPTLESIRQAFLVPTTRVRFPESLRSTWGHVKGPRFLTDPTPSWPRLTTIKVRGGFLDGIDVELGPGLNAIIGGKGTGKSTMIELLRYVLEAPPSIAPVPLAKEGVSNRESNFPSNAEAAVGFRAADGDEYMITRVGNSDGSRLRRGSEELAIGLSRRVRARIFGQRELAELPNQPDALTDFVASRLSDAADAADAAVAKTWAEARALASQLDRLDSQLGATEAAAEELRDLADRLTRMSQHGAVSLVGESDALGHAQTSVAALWEWPSQLEQAADTLAATAAPPELVSHPLLPADVIALHEQASRAFATSVANVRALAERLRGDLTQATSSWGDVLRDERERLGRSLADAGLDNPKELAELQRRHAALEQQLQGVENQERERERLRGPRRKALEDLAAARRARSRLTEDAVRDLNERTGGRVRVLVEPLSDTRPLQDFVHHNVLGKRPTAEQASRLNGTNGADLAAAIEEGKSRLLALGLTPTLADRFLALDKQKRRELEEVATADAIKVEVDLSGADEDARWTSLTQVSPGQAATAMLALALVTGDEPLLIDQPEDDLDNRFIYDEVVRQMAEVAARRQIIVATHNANIPVLGDAELVLALDAKQGRCRPLACGGLDEPNVPTTARSILEGGIEAFRARARRYNQR